MYTKHFYSRMGERIFDNNKQMNHKEQKIQKHHSKHLVKRALENRVAEYVDTYGHKYIYSYINSVCYKFIFDKNTVITVYEVDLEKEANKYELKYTY